MTSQADQFYGHAPGDAALGDHIGAPPPERKEVPLLSGFFFGFLALIWAKFGPHTNTHKPQKTTIY